MYICSLITYKMLLEKDSTAETSWENKGKNSMFDFSFIYTCTAFDRFRIRLLFAERTQRVRTTRLAFFEITMIFVSHSLLVVSLSLLERYELVFCAFQIRFQLADHIRRVFQRAACVFNIFKIFRFLSIR